MNLLADRRPEIDLVVLDGFAYSGRPENLNDAKLVPRQRTWLSDSWEARHLISECDWVVNFAAETHNDNSITNPSAFVDSNVVGVFHLLEAMKGTKARLLQVSTDEVYGDTHLDSNFRFLEDSTLRPSSPYSASKAAGDMLVMAWGRTFDVPYIISRCTNNYGPNQNKEKLIPRVLEAIKSNSPIEVYGDGKNIRDWIHVDDHSFALLRLMDFGQTGQVYNVSANNEWSNLDLVKKLIQEFDGREDQISFVGDRPGHDLRYSLDSSKVRALGWQPVRTQLGFTPTVFD